MARHGDERPFQVVRHRLDEAGLPATRRALEHQRQPLAEGRLEHLLLVADRDVVRPWRCRRHDALLSISSRSLRALGALEHATLGLRRSQRGTEQRADDRRQLVRPTATEAWAAVPNTRRSAAGVDAGADAEAQATDPAAAGLGQRPPGIGLAVAALVAVVVGEAVGDDDEQPPRRPALLLHDRGAVADGGAQAGCSAPGTRPPRRWPTRPSRRSSKPLTRMTCTDARPCELKAWSATRSPRSWSAVVSCGGREPLVLVHGSSRRSRLAGRARDVEQDQDREVAPPPQALDVERVARASEPASASTRASTAASMSMSSPWGWRRQRASPIPSRASGRRSASPSGMGIGDTRRRRAGRSRSRCTSRAGSGSGARSTRDRSGDRRPRSASASERGRGAARSTTTAALPLGPGATDAGRRVGARAVRHRRAHAVWREQALEQPAHRAPAAHRARQELPDVPRIVRRRRRRRPPARAARSTLAGGARRRPRRPAGSAALDRGQEPTRPDRPEARRRIGDRRRPSATASEASRPSTLDATSPVDDRPHRPREERLVRREGAVALDGEVAARAVRGVA